jgi:uncharacterized membrane protein YfcA
VAAGAVLAAIGLGVAIGGVGGLFGIGGGLIAIPALGLLYHFDQHTAQGTALVMVVPNVLFGFWQYRRRVGIDLRIALTLAATAVLATYAGARLAGGLDSGRLRLAFAGFLAAIAASVAWRVCADPPQAPRGLGWKWSSLVGVAGGLVSGLFGVGGAILAPPALTRWFGISQAAAQGLALALVAPAAAVALLAYADAGEVDWAVGVPLALGGVASISVGVALAHRLPERSLRLLFCGLLAATAAMLAWRG